MTAQEMMIADGAPEFVFLTAEERAANWIKHPPVHRAFGDPKFEASLALMKQQKKLREIKRLNRIRATIDPKTKKKYDLTGKRWNLRTCQWEEEL